MRRHESPTRRVNPSGKVAWVARWTDRDGRRQSAGTFPFKRDAQAAIDQAYDAHYTDGGTASRETVAAYAATWLARHPRTPRTERGYTSRLDGILGVPLNGRPLRAYRLTEVRRSEMVDLLDVLYRRGAAYSTVRATFAALSAMFEDAIGDDRMDSNPVRGVKLRSQDPRIQTAAREVRVWSWDDMRAFAAAMPGPHGPAMGRVLSDCGLRLGELLALHRADVDGEWLLVRRTAHEGVVTVGTKMHRGGRETGRGVPLPRDLAVLLRGLPPRIDSPLLFPTGRGRAWREDRFRDVLWAPARRAASAMGDARPHEFRHSYVSLMRAAGVDPADLAEWTGHTVLTATRSYTHSTGSSAELARRVAGGSHEA